jgi:hypothetical protein
VIHERTLGHEMKMQAFVMPACIAGIQSQDAFGDIHINLDSSIPCWNASRILLKTEGSRPYFQRERKEGNEII